ncbi:MAG: Rpp14/Pop5 family protein [Candidatus Bathyarchaeales archaeon]
MPVKIKRRYIALKIDCKANFNSKDLMDAIWEAFLRLFGEYGASKTGLTLIDYDEENKIAIMRLVHTEVDKIRAALTSITKIVAEPAAIHVLAVSGTLRALRKKI